MKTLPAFRLLVKLALLTVALSLLTVPSPADYIAETGRSEKKEITTDPTASAMNEESGSNEVFQLKPEELYFPKVEEALQQSGISHIAVQSEGVNTALKTFAEIQVNAITGRSRFEKQDPIYTTLGMIYQNTLWTRVPMIPVESPELARAFGLDPSKHHKISAVWIMKTPHVRNVVMGALGGNDSALKSLPPEAAKAAKKLAFRTATFLNLSGEFKLLPIKDAKGAWVSPTILTRPDLMQDSPLADKLALIDQSSEPFASMMSLHAALHKAFDEQSPDGLTGAVEKFRAQALDTPGYMSAAILNLDYWNTTFRPFKKSAWFYLAAFLAFLYYLFTARRTKTPNTDNGGTGAEIVSHEIAPAPRYASGFSMSAMTAEPALAMAGTGTAGSAAISSSMALSGVVIRTPATSGDPLLSAHAISALGSRRAWGVAYMLMGGAVLMLVVALVSRFILAGRMPVSNMYESLTFALGAFSIVSFVFEGVYRRGWIGVGAGFFGYVLMTLINSMPLHMRKVEPLVAVLNSVWLNFHVTSLLISYSCFLLGFVFCVLYIIKHLTGNRPGALPQKEMFEYLTYRAVQVGWPLLTLGIFLGAVWANTAWGSFWSWDPKETWALITWFTYTIYLHFRMIHGWTGSRSISAAMVGFIMVLVTYFGVSYLPGLAGGMHSYAEPISR